MTIEPTELTISINERDSVTALLYAAPKKERAGITVILGHGAGANQLHPFMRLFASGLAARGFDTMTFNFVYMEQGRHVPDPKAKLESCYRAVIEAALKHKNLKGNRLVIGGKSMGGRIASQVAATPETGEHITALVFLGYPLHPPGRPDKLRDAHLPQIIGLINIFTIGLNGCMLRVTMWDTCEALAITEEQREVLQTWIAARNSPQKVVFRSRIVLAAAGGMSNNRIAQELKTSRPTVILWRNRFANAGPSALIDDASGRGRPRRIPAAKVKKIVETTLHTTPKAATHWSVRTMAQVHGVSPATVQRIWDANGLQPHRSRTFKLSKDKQFVEKLNDVVGLYLNPPNKALVLCVDEKSQIQALERSQPGLPIKKGRCGTMTHDYKRHGTTTLFAALNVLDGTVIGACMPRHRHQEYLKFLRKLDRQIPSGLDLHLILDNYSTHKHDDVTQWLAQHPRFHMHYTPTGSSWLNLVERWFRELTQKRLRRGNFIDVKELITAIKEYLAQNNKQPKPFIWTATAQQIIDKVGRCKGISETLH